MPIFTVKYFSKINIRKSFRYFKANFLLFGNILRLLYILHSSPIGINICYLDVSPLSLHLVAKINVLGVPGSAVFRNHLKFRPFLLLSQPCKGTTSKYRRHAVYLSISKCNAKM